MSDPLSPVPFAPSELERAGTPPGEATPTPANHGGPGRGRVLEAIMFTDLERSMELEQTLGTELYATVLTRHGEIFHAAIRPFEHSNIEHTGDGFMARFTRASDAVAAALRFQWLLRHEDWKIEERVRVRIGIHQGEILLLPTVDQMPGMVGGPLNLAARVMAMAEGGQILLTRTVFDAARQFIREIPGIVSDVVLGWEAHGSYVVRGIENPVEIFEVGERGKARFHRPPSTPNAQRVVSAEDETTLGWRPAKGMEVPKRHGWVLQRRLGQGGFGEVWMAENRQTRDTRVFKFCFDAARLRSLKRELVLFRLISGALGPRPDIATLHEVQLESAPFFLESEYCPGGTLREWLEAKQATGGVPLPKRLAIVARIARALAAAHSVGVIHKDVKPSNIFIEEGADGEVRPRLADFGIGSLSDPSTMASLDLTFSAELTITDDLSRSGTRMYSAPEYMIGRPASVLADIYSLGVLLYHVVIEDFERPLGAGWQRAVADPLLVEDIANCVDVEPERRFSSALQLAESLENIEQRRAAAAAALAAETAEKKRLEELAANRRRLQRALTAAVVATLLLAALSVVVLVQVRAKKAALHNATALGVEREVARDRLYVADLLAATDNALQRRAEAGRELLNRHIPAPGERDRRGWEWFFANSMLNTRHVSRAVSSQPLRALAISPDAIFAAVAGDDGEVSIWSCETLEKSHSWQVGSDPILCLDWHSSGLLAIGLASGEVILWNPATKREEHRWKAHERGVTALDWNSREAVLTTGGGDGKLASWSATGQPLRTVRKQGSVQALNWRGDGDELAVVLGHPTRLLVGRFETFDQEHETALAVPESPVAWRPNARELAISLNDMPMCSWDPHTTTDSFNLPRRFSPGASSFAWSASGNDVAVGGVDGKILLLDGRRIKEARLALYGHTRRVTALHWLGGARERLISVGEDGYLRAWDDLRHSPEIFTFPLGAHVAHASWHPAENRLAVLVAGDEARVLDGSTGQTLWSRPLPAPLRTVAPFTGGQLTWSPDGQWLAAVCAGRAPVVWRVEGEERVVFGSAEDATSAQWLPDSRRLLLRDPAGWSLAEVATSRRIPVSGTEQALWIGPLNHERLAMVRSTGGGAEYLQTSLTGQPGAAVALPAGIGAVRIGELSPDRSRLGLATQTGTVLWVDTQTGAAHRPALSHAGPVTAMGWHPSGTRLASTGADGSCRIFNIGQVAQNWIINHEIPVEIVATGWSADGHRLMLASGAGRETRFYVATSALPQPTPATAPANEFTRALGAACAALARHPGEEFPWSTFATEVRREGRAASESELKLLLAAARLGHSFRFRRIDEPPLTATEILTTWQDVPIPRAVQVAQACALEKWESVLGLTAQTETAPGAEWFLLARAEALAQLGRQREAESANLLAWQALRHSQAGDDSFNPPPTRTRPNSVDLSPWTNIKFTEDWNGGENNNLRELTSAATLENGVNFHFGGEFIQLAGKSLRLGSGRMLPRSTGWMPLTRPAKELTFALAACHIDAPEPLQDVVCGSIFLLRRGGVGAARIPLIYGRNIWDWWTPPGGEVSEAPAEAVAWRGNNPNARYHEHGIAIYWLAWSGAAADSNVEAISIVSHLRRPAPFLVAAELR